MKDVIKIQEEVVIEQDGKKIILEKGDKLKLLKEAKGQLSVVLFGAKILTYDKKDLDKFLDYKNETVLEEYRDADNLPKWINMSLKNSKAFRDTFGKDTDCKFSDWNSIYWAIGDLINTNSTWLNLRSDRIDQNGYLIID